MSDVKSVNYEFLFTIFVFLLINYRSVETEALQSSKNSSMAERFVLSRNKYCIIILHIFICAFHVSSVPSTLLKALSSPSDKIKPSFVWNLHGESKLLDLIWIIWIVDFVTLVCFNAFPVLPMSLFHLYKPKKKSLLWRNFILNSIVWYPLNQVLLLILRGYFCLLKYVSKAPSFFLKKISLYTDIAVTVFWLLTVVFFFSFSLLLLINSR